MRYFYIDTENVDVDAWCHSLHRLQGTDVVYIIYTNKSGKVPIDCIESIHNSKAKIHVISTLNGTTNALDFVLVAKLARQSATAEKSKHVIISKDHGYGAAITFLYNEGVKVSQQETLSQALSKE